MEEAGYLKYEKGPTDRKPSALEHEVSTMLKQAEELNGKARHITQLARDKATDALEDAVQTLRLLGLEVKVEVTRPNEDGPVKRDFHG